MEENWAYKASGNSMMLDKVFIDMVVAGGEELLIEVEIDGGIVALGSALVD